MSDSDVAAVVEHELALPDQQLDYARAKIAFDGIVDATQDAAAIDAELDRLTEGTKQLIGKAVDEDAVMAALRRFIYESGPWNEHRPFGYDHDDPNGQEMRNAMLGRYLKDRRGNCIAMPILLLILGNRLGLDLTLAAAPLHVFVRWRRQDGQVVNLEATSGAHPARDEWYRERMPMREEAVRNGVYLRTLSKRESIAAMADTVADHLISSGRFGQAIAVANSILRRDPRNCHALAKRGAGYSGLIETELKSKYPSPHLIPAILVSRYMEWAAMNAMSFAAAEQLGWEEVSLRL